MKKSVFFLFFLFSIVNSPHAEILDIGSSVKIQIPETLAYIKYKNKIKENMKSVEFTREEIKHHIFLFNQQGFDLNEYEYLISSKKGIEWKKRENTPQGKEINTNEMQGLSETLCSKEITDKSFYNCVLRETYKRNNFVRKFVVILGNNISDKIKKLNDLSDSDIAVLTENEIKNVKKIHGKKIKFVSKNKLLKETGIRNIKILSDGRFYIESMSTIERPGMKETQITWTIPMGNRTFTIRGDCFNEYCMYMEETMAQIIEPTFFMSIRNDAYDFTKKEEVLNLLGRVKNGYRIYKMAKLLIFLL